MNDLNAVGIIFIFYKSYLMRNLSVILVALGCCATLGFGACTVQQPISAAPAVNNQDYKVEYLFEHEGCKVYRFRDGSYYVYFTNCNGEAIARTDSTAVKNTIRLHPIER